MKTRYYVYIPLLVAFAGMSSCIKSKLLNQSPVGTIADATFWKSPNDLQLYCNNFYAALTTNPSNNANYYVDNNSDNLCPTSRNTWLNGEGLVPTTGGGWSYSDWSEIRDVNYFLTHYGATGLPFSDISEFVGEAYFFRAYFYFSKLQQFGALPWINTLLSQKDTSFLFSARLPRNVIADSIISDLNKAIAYLPPKSSAPAMRICKEIAEGFESRVALFEGTWEKYHQGDPFGVPGQDGSAFLQIAANAADSVMLSGAYSLDYIGQPNLYQDLFNQTDYSSSKEIMWWRKYQQGVITTAWNRYSNSGGGTGMTKRLVESFLCTDGLPIALSPSYKGDDSLAAVVKNRDPRLKAILYVRGDIMTQYEPTGPNAVFEAPNFTAALDQVCTTGYQLEKGNNTDPEQVNFTTRGLIYMRYAEILLNYAEAKAELGTITQQDLDRSINLLRDRVKMPHLVMGSIATDPNWEFPHLSPLINEIRRERNVELACAGFRYEDIMRWAAVPQLIEGWKPKGAKWAQWNGVFPTVQPGNGINVDAAGYIEPLMNDPLMANGYQFNVNKDYLNPLPLDQLTLNPKLTQNPGWQ